MVATDLSPNTDNYYMGQGIVKFRSADTAYEDVGEPVVAGAFVVGNTYRIETVGTTDFTLIGADANTVGEIFTATGAGTGDGTATLVEKPWRDLGNVPRFEFTTSVSKLAHQSSRTGIRSKDKEVVTQQEATVGITLDEFSGPNLAMFLLGIQTGSDAEAVIEIGRHSQINGELLFIGTNDIGPKWNFYFDNVGFAPDGSFSAIGGGTDWGAFQLTADIFMVTVGGVERFGLAARALADIPQAANA